MPFIEVLGFERDAARRRAASERMTSGLAEAYGIGEDIISVYFITFDGASYAHAGRLSPGAEHERVLIKVHAYARDEDKRAAAARALTGAVAGASGLRPKNVAVYFLERTPAEVAHEGVLESRRPPR
jgi:phenylpyruvate tautomerase PptA (4-oxalocrotonate tautomerase family)